MSANLTARQEFSPSCPSGGTWWACGYGTYFVGCCARDPCEITCAQGNLYPGAFDPKAYGTFPDATCGTGSKFYTCAAGKTFWGCCKTNPCAQNGCPDGDLEPAILNRDDLLSAYHATGGSTTIGSPSTSTASASPKKSDDGTPVAAIAGGAAGGVFAAAAAVGIVVWWLCLRRKRKAKKEHDYEETGPNGIPGGAMGEIHQHHHKNSESPPSYTSPNPNFTHTFYGPQSQDNPYSHPNYGQSPGEPYLSPLGHSPHDSVAAHNYQGPQELPLSTPSTPNTPGKFRNHKSMYSHARGPSELSGDEPHNELDSSHPASPELSGSSPGRKWSWDDNKEKLQYPQDQNQAHDAEAGGIVMGKPGRSPPMPRWQEARWEEQRIDERAAYADPRQRLLQAVRREREEEERHQRGQHRREDEERYQRSQRGEEDEEERGDSTGEEDSNRRSNVQHSGRPRSPQGLGLLDVLDQGPTDRKSGESGRKS